MDKVTNTYNWIPYQCWVNLWRFKWPLIVDTAGDDDGEEEGGEEEGAEEERGGGKEEAIEGNMEGLRTPAGPSCRRGISSSSRGHNTIRRVCTQRHEHRAKVK